MAEDAAETLEIPVEGAGATEAIEGSDPVEGAALHPEAVVVEGKKPRTTVENPQTRNSKDFLEAMKRRPGKEEKTTILDVFNQNAREGFDVAATQATAHGIGSIAAELLSRLLGETLRNNSPENGGGHKSSQVIDSTTTVSETPGKSSDVPEPEHADLDGTKASDAE